MTPAIRVVIADDHHIVRRGLRALLERQHGIKVIGEATDGQEALAAVERLRPHVLVLDLMMPGANGLEVARQLADKASPTRIVILTMYGHEDYLVEALRANVAGYVLKGADSADLVKAIRAAAAGRRYLSAPLEMPVRADTGAPGPGIDAYTRLTAREREVLRLLAEGARNPDVSARLGIRPRTAETHRTNLMRKLNLHSQSDLIRYAMQRGIIGPGYGGAKASSPIG